MARQDEAIGAGDATGRTVIGAEEARQGRIVLTTRRRRIVFVSGLVGGVVLALVVALAG